MNLILQKFLISLAAGKTNNFLSKIFANNTVEKQIALAYDQALKDFNPNPTIEIIDRLKFKGSFKKIASSITGENIPALDKEEIKFIEIFYKKLKQQDIAWREIQAIYFEGQGSSLRIIESKVINIYSDLEDVKLDLNEIKEKIDGSNLELLSKLTEIQNSLSEVKEDQFQIKFEEKILNETGYQYEEIKTFLKDIISESNSLEQVGLAFYNLLRYEKSKTLLFESFQKNPAQFSPDSYYPLLISCSKDNDLEKLVHVGNIINKFNSTNFNKIPRDALSTLAFFATQLGNNALAVKLINRAIELEPDEPSSRLIKGLTLEKQKLYDEAIKQFQFSFDHGSNKRNALRKIVSCFRLLNDIESSIEKSELGKNLYPNDYFFPYNIGASYTDISLTPEKAIFHFDEALKLEVNSKILFGKALALKKLKRNPEALNVINKAIKVNTNNPDLYNLRGQIYHQIGDYENVENDRKIYEKMLNQSTKFDINAEEK